MTRIALLDRLSMLVPAGTADRIALRDARHALRYGELIAAVDTLADWLLEQNCRVVALDLDNAIEWVLLDLACQAAGVICLPLPDFFSAAQRRHCLAAARADLLIATAPDDDAHWQPLPTRQTVFAQKLPGAQAHATKTPWPSGTQKITFTSGSTGHPKGVCLDATLPWRVAQSLADAVGLRGTRHLCLLPLSTLLENIAGVYTPLLCGGEVLLPAAATRGLSGSSGLHLPALLGCIDREQPQSLILLPQLLLALVAACDRGWLPPVSLRFIAVGGARVAPDLIRRARAAGLPVYEGYGLSECGSVVALNTPRHDDIGSVGRVLPHCRVAIENDEIIVSGAAHLGYLDEPSSWWPARIATGDLGSYARDGELRIGGRRKNLLISAFGRNINPEWIESELGAAPPLTQCVVIGEGRPHLAALVGAPSPISDAAIRQRIDSVNATLPDYARVLTWLRLDATAWAALVTANGRPRRDVIAQRYAAAIDDLYALHSNTASDLCS